MPTVIQMDASKTKQFAEAFRTSLPLPSALDPHFEETLRHVLDNPGSLVRPRMVIQVAAAYGLDAAAARDLAVSLEYFHTASLLFDDLPCMDDASVRRGVPCVHLAFGQAGAGSERREANGGDATRDRVVPGSAAWVLDEHGPVWI